MIRRVLVLASLLLAAACGSGDGDEAEPGRGGDEIVLTDFALEPARIELEEPGPATFRVVNAGGTAHALAVEGEDVAEETALLQPGESAELTVDLGAGEHDLFCPVGGHREQGMEGTLLVGTSAAGGTERTDTDTDADEDEGPEYPYGP